MKEMNLISVVVPVYKVEEYLDECITSVVNQTYKNLEIILVDDGSPDKCPSMCDEWAKKDSRIRVIHKKNGGLSSARNAGLDVAKGDYVSFVDSDDFFDEKMYEVLYEGITRSSNIGIAGIKFLKFTNGDATIYNKAWDTKEDVLIKSSEFGIKTLKEEICHAATNKLYRKELLQFVRFREGKLNEDTLFSFDLAKEVERLKYDMWDLDYYAYYYRMRQNSICHSEIPIEISYLNNLQTIINESEIGDYKSAAIAKYRRTVFYWRRRVLSNPNDELMAHKNQYFIQFWKEIRTYKYSDVNNGHGSLRGLFVFFIIKYFPQLYSMIKMKKEISLLY